MPDVLATWDDFRGGHWGNLGPHAAQDNQFGGVNMTLARDGGLVPVCASRWLQTNATPAGRVLGMFWAWGSDSNLYFIQQAGTQTAQSRLYKFNPSITSIPATITTTSVFTWVGNYDPDWCEVGLFIHVTMYGVFTYLIRTATNVLEILTGSYGNAAAGRAITQYKERLFVGGILDLRFGLHTNRIAFSGDDTNNITYDTTAWESLNYFDVGAFTDWVVGLYVLRDYLVIIMDDQSIYLANGTPNLNMTVRRVYGFNKSAGAVTTFRSTHAVVDPSQTRLWMFDHTMRVPLRFNGASITRIPNFGAPRYHAPADDTPEGNTTMIGGPDEFLSVGVAVGRAAGEKTAAHKLMLVRTNGVYTLVQQDVVAQRQT